MTARVWIKAPHGILADRAERGVVVSEGRIVECVDGRWVGEDGPIPGLDLTAGLGDTMRAAKALHAG